MGIRTGYWFNEINDLKPEILNSALSLPTKIKNISERVMTCSTMLSHGIVQKYLSCWGKKKSCYLTNSRWRYTKWAALKASKLKCCNLFMSQVNFHHKPSQLFSKTLSLAVFGTYSFCNLKAELLLGGGTKQKSTWFIWYSNQGRAPRKTFIDSYIAQEHQNRLLYVNLTAECLWYHHVLTVEVTPLQKLILLLTTL